MRGSDVDAALHYLARMIEAGEDPRFIARRIIVSASEDIGMADPQALVVAIAAADAVQYIGMPEGRIPLAQAVVHLATAPKSNAAYNGINAAIADVKAGKIGRVPKPLRDAHYAGAKRLGHGKGYKYPHDDDDRRRRAAVPAERAEGHPLLRADGARQRARGRRAAGETAADHPRQVGRLRRPARRSGRQAVAVLSFRRPKARNSKRGCEEPGARGNTTCSRSSPAADPSDFTGHSCAPVTTV